MLQSIVHGQMNKIKVAMNVRLGSKADIRPRDQDVCFGPIPDSVERAKAKQAQ
jgi:hypothetical protein